MPKTKAPNKPWLSKVESTKFYPKVSDKRLYSFDERDKKQDPARSNGLVFRHSTIRRFDQAPEIKDDWSVEIAGEKYWTNTGLFLNYGYRWEFMVNLRKSGLLAKGAMITKYVLLRGQLREVTLYKDKALVAIRAERSRTGGPWIPLPDAAAVTEVKIGTLKGACTSRLRRHLKSSKEANPGDVIESVVLGVVVRAKRGYQSSGSVRCQERWLLSAVDADIVEVDFVKACKRDNIVPASLIRLPATEWTPPKRRPRGSQPTKCRNISMPFVPPGTFYQSSYWFWETYCPALGKGMTIHWLPWNTAKGLRVTRFGLLQEIDTIKKYGQPKQRDPGTGKYVVTPAEPVNGTAGNGPDVTESEPDEKALRHPAQKVLKLIRKHSGLNSKAVAGKVKMTASTVRNIVNSELRPDFVEPPKGHGYFAKKIVLAARKHAQTDSAPSPL